MATIRERRTKDGDLRYQVVVRLKGHPIQRATFRRKTDAKKWAQDTESAVRQGRHFATVKAKKYTFDALIEKYLAEVLPELADQRNRKRQLDWWRSQLGPFVLADITAEVISDFKAQLRKEKVRSGDKRSPATVNRFLAALSHVFTIAQKEWHWVEQNPVFSVAKLDEPAGRVRFLDDHERKDLLKACRDSEDALLYPVVILALSTGARKGEILSLRWPDVDLQRQVAVLRNTKNGETRALPLAGEALKELKSLSKVRRIDVDYVFPGKSPKRPATIDRAWRKSVDTAGVSDFRFHDLRHSCASYLAMNGASLAEIAAVLGHKTLAMVKRYSHLSEQHTMSVVASMNEKIFGDG